MLPNEESRLKAGCAFFVEHLQFAIINNNFTIQLINYGQASILFRLFTIR